MLCSISGCATCDLDFLETTTQPLLLVLLIHTTIGLATWLSLMVGVPYIGSTSFECIVTQRVQLQYHYGVQAAQPYMM